MYMLHKIIYKNFKSNIRKYILFFVSNIMAVAELFIFWGLNDVVVRAVTEPSIMMGIKSDFMIAVGLITVITILLMVFSMRYYIKLRAKDYGTFIMLGMKKKMSYMLLFAEYIIGCIGSLLIGIFSGNLLLYRILYCLNQCNPQIITFQKVDPSVYKNTILLCLGVMLGIFYNSSGVDGWKKFKHSNDERGNKGKTSCQFKMAAIYNVGDYIYNTCN